MKRYFGNKFAKLLLPVFSINHKIPDSIYRTMCPILVTKRHHDSLEWQCSDVFDSLRLSVCFKSSVPFQRTTKETKRLCQHNLYTSHSSFHHRWPKLKIRDKRYERDSSVVLCYNGLNLNYKGLYGKIIDLFSIVEIIVV